MRWYLGLGLGAGLPWGILWGFGGFQLFAVIEAAARNHLGGYYSGTPLSALANL